VLLFLDPPDHDRIRRTASRAFTARAISDLEPRIAVIADELIDAFVAQGGGDAVAEFTGRLPVYVIGEVLGVPTADWEQLRGWSDATVRALGGDPAPEAAEGAAALHRYLDSIAVANVGAPSDSIIGRLVALEQTEEISHSELIGFLQLLFVAGHETTAALLCRAVELLATDPGLLADVRADPTRIESLVEEVLRTYGPLQRVFRVATAEAEIGGVSVPAGAIVIVLLGAGSRDTGHFPSGDELNLDAADSAHLAFGHGIHFCLGAPLARLEARVAIQRFTAAVARVALEPNRPPVRFVGGTSSELQTTSLFVTFGVDQ
jgi:cytochrome P450